MIKIEVSVGELLDRVSILLLKSKCSAAAKSEYLRLYLSAGTYISQCQSLYDLLVQVNQTLWDLEDDVRAAKTDAEFLIAAKQIPVINDRRASIKRKISELFRDIPEDKVYA